MKLKNLVVLVVVAAVLVSLAVVTSRRDNAPAPDAVGLKLLPDLPLNDVEKITVYTTQDTVTVARTSGIWTCPSRHDYPADFEQVRDILLKLAEIKIGQVVLVDDHQRGDLKMIPPARGDIGAGTAPADQRGTLVELHGPGGRLLASVLAGAPYMRRTEAQFGGTGTFADGQYVSPDMGKTTYVISESLAFLPKDATALMDRQLLKVEATELAVVSITGPEREPISFTSPQKGARLELSGLGEDEKPVPGKISGLENALAYFDIEDVADPSLSDEDMGLTEPITFSAATHAGVKLDLLIGNEAEERNARYVRVAASFEEPAAEEPAETEEETAESGEEAATAPPSRSPEEIAREREAAQRQVREINDKASAWTYLIENYKLEMMIPLRADLIEQAPPPSPAGDEPAEDTTMEEEE